jgi:hypothetical protein
LACSQWFRLGVPAPADAAQHDRRTSFLMLSAADGRKLAPDEFRQTPLTSSIWVIRVLLTFGGLFNGYALSLVAVLGPRHRSE